MHVVEGSDKLKVMHNETDKKSETTEDDFETETPDGGCLAWSIVTASFFISFLQVLYE